MRLHGMVWTLLGVVAVVSGCNSMKGYEGPDAFRVVANPPLRLPPDYTLRPPQEKADSSMVARRNTGWQPVGKPDPEKAASFAGVNGEMLPEPAESSFLQRAGADSANPEIRQLLTEDAERLRKAQENKGIVRSLFGLEPSEEALKPAAKAEAEPEESSDSSPEPLSMTQRIMQALFGKEEPVTEAQARELEATQPAAGGERKENGQSAAGNEENSLQRFWDELFE